MTLRLAVLASGSGTNVQAMLDSVAKGVLDADIRLVICNRPGAKVLDRARAAGIPCCLMDHRLWSDRASFDSAVVEAIQEVGADTVALAGYMRMLTPTFLQAFPGRVLNIHPALLPSFPGVHGIEEARDWGVRLTGCTVHLVDEIMDHGSIIIQAAVPVRADEPLEALAARIHACEHRIYPQALQWLAEQRLELAPDGRTLYLLPGNRPLAPTAPTALIFPPLEEGF
ncbi:MAG: phosphoribosylglycinamide formyltransferase [Bilophila sp.]